MSPSFRDRYAPTLADVAKACGVSISTASLALRGSPKIKMETRCRVVEQASQLRYSPDPNIGKLMTLLRSRRSRGFLGTICGLVHCPDQSPYVRRLITAASFRANQLGYSLVVEEIPCGARAARLHERSLITRGIEGLLFLPSPQPIDISALYSWDKFALISMGYNPVSPAVDRVATSWLSAIRICSSTLKARGFRRVGIVVGVNFDVLFRFHLTAAMAEQAVTPGAVVVKPLMYIPKSGERESPYLCPKYSRLLKGAAVHPNTGCQLEVFPDSIVDWYRRECPDVLLVDFEETAAVVMPYLTKRVGHRVECAVISRSPQSPYAGVCPQAEPIGSMAIDLLNLKILNGSKGLPAHPFDQLYHGEWMEGQSLRTSS